MEPKRELSENDRRVIRDEVKGVLKRKRDVWAYASPEQREHWADSVAMNLVCVRDESFVFTSEWAHAVRVAVQDDFKLYTLRP